MYKWSQLNRKPVIVLVTGEELGKVFDLILDDCLNVVGIQVGILNTVVIPIKNILSIQESCIYVQSAN